MVKCMHKQVIKRVKIIITSFKYFALSCDEVKTINNQSWIFIHKFYVVQDWCHIPIPISLKQVTEKSGQII